MCGVSCVKKLYIAAPFLFIFHISYLFFYTYGFITYLFLNNTVTEYCITEKNVIGCFQDKKDNYDLIDIIIIGLGGLEKKDDETIIGFLDNILDRDLESLMRRKILKEKFDITTDEGLMEVFDDMCNLSDGVYLDGVEKGIIQGKAEGIIQGKAEGLAQGRLELIKNSFNKFKSFDECINFFNITDKNEIKFLRENL